MELSPTCVQADLKKEESKRRRAEARLKEKAVPIAQAHLLVKPSLLSSVVQKEKAVVIPARAERERIEKAVRDEVERTKDRTPSKREKPQVRMVNGKQHVVTEFTNAAGEKSYLSEPVTGSRTQRERQLAGPDPVKDDNIVRLYKPGVFGPAGKLICFSASKEPGGKDDEKAWRAAYIQYLLQSNENFMGAKDFGWLICKAATKAEYERAAHACNNARLLPRLRNVHQNIDSRLGGSQIAVLGAEIYPLRTIYPGEEIRLTFGWDYWQERVLLHLSGERLIEYGPLEALERARAEGNSDAQRCAAAADALAERIASLQAQEERAAEAAREEERHRREVIAAEREGRKLAGEQPYSLPGEPHRMPRASSKGTKEVLTADKKAKREANKEHSIELANAHQQLLKQNEEERIAEVEAMARSIALGEAIARGD